MMGTMASNLGRVFMSMAKARTVVCALLLGAVLAGHGADVPRTVSWSQLQSLNSNLPLAGQHSAAQELDGKTVSIPGFMVPLEDDLNQVTEFLLVPYAPAFTFRRLRQTRWCT